MEEIKSHLQKIIKMKMDKMILSDPVVQTMDLQNIDVEEYSYINYELKKDLYKQIDQYVEENEFNVDFIYEDPELLQEIIKFFNKHGGKIKYSLSPNNQLLQTYFGNTFILTNKDFVTIYLYNLYFEINVYSIFTSYNISDAC